jgi:hypothetical protein
MWKEVVEALGKTTKISHTTAGLRVEVRTRNLKNKKQTAILPTEPSALTFTLVIV